MNQCDGVLLGGEYRDHQVGWEPSSSQRLLQDGLGNQGIVRGGEESGEVRYLHEAPSEWNGK